MGFGIEVQLDENRNRSQGTQVRGGPYRRELHRQEWREGARRVVQRRRRTHRDRLLHPARRAQHREEKIESSGVRNGVRRGQRSVELVVINDQGRRDRGAFRTANEFLSMATRRTIEYTTPELPIAIA